MDSTITIAGNLTRDPELKFTDSGMATVRFGVATSRKIKERETTSFYEVIAFGKTAENVQASLSKGNRVLVTGRLEVRNWEKQDGTKATTVEVVADEVAADLKFATVTIMKNERKEFAKTSAPSGKNFMQDFEEDF
jgi:single-strand DNA-binding protein